MEKLFEYLDVCEKATPGPWSACIGSGVNVCTGIGDGKGLIVADCLTDYMIEENCAPKDHRPNMNFIILARQAFPDVVTELIHRRSNDAILKLLIEDISLLIEDIEAELESKSETRKVRNILEIINSILN